MDITISYGSFQIDLKVNRKQKIEDAISVLEDNGMLLIQETDNYMIFSERKRVRINRHLTYEQAEIYSGDILYIRGENE